jgi:hypothetical protein
MFHNGGATNSVASIRLCYPKLVAIFVQERVKFPIPDGEIFLGRFWSLLGGRHPTLNEI